MPKAHLIPRDKFFIHAMKADSSKLYIGLLVVTDWNDSPVAAAL